MEHFVLVSSEMGRNAVVPYLGFWYESLASTSGSVFTFASFFSNDSEMSSESKLSISWLSKLIFSINAKTETLVKGGIVKVGLGSSVTAKSYAYLFLLDSKGNSMSVKQKTAVSFPNAKLQILL